MRPLHLTQPSCSERRYTKPTIQDEHSFLELLAKPFKPMICSGSWSDCNPLKCLKMGWNPVSTHVWESIREALLLSVIIFVVHFIKHAVRMLNTPRFKREKSQKTMLSHNLSILL